MNRDKMASFLSSLRKEKILKQQDIAEIFNVSPQAVSKWEKGESVPDIEILEKISSFYDVSIEEILNGEKSQETVDRTDTIEVRASNNTLVSSKDEDTIMGRLSHIIFGILFMACTLGLFFLPYLTDGTFYFTGYNVLGSPKYKGGNVILLLLYIASYALGLIDIIDGSLSKKYKGLIYARNFLFLFVLGGYIGILIPLLLNWNSAVGSIVLVLLSSAYYICNLFIPSYRKERNLLSINHDIRELHINTLAAVIIISILIFSAELVINESIILIILNILFSASLLATIFVSLACYIKKLKLTKFKIVLMSLAVALNIAIICLDDILFNNNSTAIVTVALVVLVILQLFSILYYYLYFKKHNTQQ